MPVRIPEFPPRACLLEVLDHIDPIEDGGFELSERPYGVSEVPLSPDGSDSAFRGWWPRPKRPPPGHRGTFMNKN
jgi:hypothetical protein